jgi:hypothetical protein
MSSFGIPATQPRQSDVIKYTMKVFSSFPSFCDFFDNIAVESTRSGSMSSTYKGVYDTIRQQQASAIRSGDSWWLGRRPYPKSVDEAMARTEYQHMDEYNDFYKNVIEPEASKFLNDSKADLDAPVIKYNDRQLGFFDFTRASAGLFPKYAYYSLKYKKIVDGNEVETYKEANKFKYRLKTDGSPCVVMPMVMDGQDPELLHEACERIYKGEDALKALRNFKLKLGGFSSTIKKSYVYQEILPKPKNAVRLFISIGGNSDIGSENLKWAGYLGVGLTQILEFLGYSVSIYFTYGLKNTGFRKKSGQYGAGVRFVCFPLKKFQETLAAPNILYTVSDGSFFRIRFFQYIIKMAQYYKDEIDTGLGSSLRGKEGEDILKNAIYNEFSTIDPLFINGKKNPQCPFLYYIVSNCHSEQRFRELLREIILDTINENRLAREGSGFVKV